MLPTFHTRYYYVYWILGPCLLISFTSESRLGLWERRETRWAECPGGLTCCLCLVHSGREGEFTVSPLLFLPTIQAPHGKGEWGVRSGSRPALSDSGTDSSPWPHRKSGGGACTPSGKGGQDPFLTFKLNQERQKQNL